MQHTWILSAFSCITIRYTAPTHAIFYKTGNLKVIASKLLVLLQELNLVDNPLFIHLFSNGGGLVYRYMSELVHQNSKYKHIKFRGVILDSCPAHRKISVAVKALLASTRNIFFLLRYTLVCFFGVYLAIQSMFTCALEMVGVKENTQTNYWQALLADQNRCPQLFLFSKTDEIVSYYSVEEFIQHRLNLGVKVHSICWDDSPHVQHFRHHREAYMQNCTSFLNSCLFPGRDGGVATQSTSTNPNLVSLYVDLKF